MQTLIVRLFTSINWKPVLQRLPGCWLLLSLTIALFAPIFAPHIYLSYSLFLHTALILNVVRVQRGVQNAYSKVKEHATTNWLDKYCKKTNTASSSDASHDIPYDSIRHIIIIPNYSETLETLTETLDVLASHSCAYYQYRICLAMEEAEACSSQKAIDLSQRYHSYFREIKYTIHPNNIPGEVPGKSSNVAWASRKMAIDLKNDSLRNSRNEIVTVMDADTCFSEDYFSSLNYHYAVASVWERKLMMFVPPLIFDRNLNDVPFLVRTFDAGWSVGHMSNLYDSSEIKIPCSAYSLSMDLCISVDFWDTTAEAYGEDFHMFLKCFFATQGRLISKAIFSPASSSNVEGGLNIKPSVVKGRVWEQVLRFYSGVRARQVQGKRHMWAALDIGYMFRRILLGVVAPEFDRKTNNPNFNASSFPDGKEERVSVFTLFNLMHRVFDALGLVAHAIVFIITANFIIPLTTSSTSFWQFFGPTVPVPAYLITLVYFSKLIQLSLLPINIITWIYYHKYHQFVGFERWSLQTNDFGHRRQSITFGNTLNGTYQKFTLSNVAPENQNLRVFRLGKRATLCSPRKFYTHLIESLFASPFAAILFYIIPLFQCNIAQLFTDKLVYQVAAKPTIPVGHPVYEVAAGRLTESASLDTLVDLQSGRHQSFSDEGYFEDEQRDIENDFEGEYQGCLEVNNTN